MILPRKLALSPGLVSLVIAFLAYGGVLSVRELGKFQSAELRVYDTFVRWKAATAAEDPRIVLVAITEDDINNPELGDWPLWDADLAKLLTILEAQQPTAIAVDLIRDLPVPKRGDSLAQLNEVLLANANIICMWAFGDEHRRGLPPPPVLRPYPERLGTTSFTVDDQIDKIVRRGVLFMDDGTNTYPSMALQLALIYLGTQGVGMEGVPDHPERFRLGKTVFHPFEANDGAYVDADARGYQLLLDFRGPKRLQTYALTEVLSNRLPPAALRGKIILLGVTAESATDAFATPLAYQHHGIQVNAQLLSQLLRAALDGDRPLEVWSERQELLWILLWCALGAVIGFWVRSPWTFVIVTTACLLGLAGCAWWSFQKGWWILLATPATSFLVSSIVVVSYVSYHEQMERSVIMTLFSKHVSRQVADTIWEQREAFLQGGTPRPQRVTATVLFTDLEGFSSLSEHMDPAAVLEWLNEYMDGMTRAVIEHEGVVHKYVGDAVMAVFGVPVARTSADQIARDATNAVRAALAMEEALIGLNERWKAEGRPTCRMRVGIYTGPLVAGSLGSSERMEYTVLGDTVNTASRLESTHKNPGEPASVYGCCRILIGDTTHNLLDGQFETTLIGPLPLKGKAEQITIYQVMGRGERKEPQHA